MKVWRLCFSTTRLSKHICLRGYGWEGLGRLLGNVWEVAGAVWGDLLDSVERPEEAEPEPEQTPPDVDIENIDDVLDDALNLNFKFKAKRQGVFADGSYVPIFQVPPQYPRRAMERGIEGCVLLEYTVTIAGAVSDPKVIKAIPPNIFDRAATRAALRYKYKPLIRDGVAVPVEGVRQRITFVLESIEKGPGYIPENCRGQM